jgi:hypothetical protein
LPDFYKKELLFLLLFLFLFLYFGFSARTQRDLNTRKLAFLSARPRVSRCPKRPYLCYQNSQSRAAFGLSAQTRSILVTQVLEPQGVSMCPLRLSRRPIRARLVWFAVAIEVEAACRDTTAIERLL